MITHKNEILRLAKSLFCSAEWPYIESYLESCSTTHSKIIVLGNDVAAFVIVNTTQDGNAFISYCGVSPAHQGKGYGSKLLKETLASIFQVDYPSTQLYVDKWNVDALRLYMRLGFLVIGEDVVAGSPCYLLELSCDSWKKSQARI
jgi:ribosomal protein S18 acetylase RimI-like enzyme